jgi:predicted TIM-barrel fold metal-dependent hydrolase
MRFNCHTHVFNFRSLFTEATLEILLNRLTRQKWPDFVIEALKKILKKLIKGEYLDEEELLRQFVQALGVSDKFKEYLGDLNKAIPADVSLIVHGDTDDLAIGALREILRKLGDLVSENHDAENQTLNDLVGFLAIGIQPSIDQVARKLMELSGEDTAVVALTLDITKGGSADRELFEKQIESTSRAALAFPGRLFPFVAVNTVRADHYAIMEKALTTQGYLGVKLYPSLGYKIQTPEMDRVLQYCEENGVPLLMHCNRGGFYAREEYRDYCDPAQWSAVLASHPKLRICFGHFGGDENLVEENIPDGSWTATILQLMEAHEGVYADIAYHDAPMRGGDAEKNYFANLAALLKASTVRDRILFGSDFFLLRVRLREDSHWRYFESKFSSPEFRRITETNPRAFLGLPAEDGTGAQANLDRYVDFIAGHNKEVGALPSAWLLAAIKARCGEVKFYPNPWGVRWSINNDAHYYAWQYFRTMMRPDHVGLSFNEAGGLLVRQLKGWPTEQVDKSVRAGRLREHAASMHLALVNQDNGPGAVPEPGVTRKQAERVLCELFDNGDTRLAEFGEPVDGLYRFKQENQP